MALVRRTVTEVDESYVVIAVVFVGEGKARTKGNLRCNNAVSAVEMFLFREHVHRAAFTAAVAALATSKFSHDTFWIHTTGQHVAVITIRCDALVAFFCSRFQANNNGFLANVEVAKTADQTHAIKLACFFFKAANE